jgi:hypothetical protein
MKQIKVYAAGKITANDWRGVRNASTDPEAWLACVAGVGRPTCAVPQLDRTIVYAGPFFISCDHGCYHGRDNHGVGADGRGCGSDGIDPNRVVSASLDGIDHADIVYVRLDAEGAYGTMAEIGYALAVGKPFVVDVDPALPDAVRRDYWFVIAAMERRLPSVPDEAAVREVFKVGTVATWR